MEILVMGTGGSAWIRGRSVEVLVSITSSRPGVPQKLGARQMSGRMNAVGLREQRYVGEVDTTAGCLKRAMSLETQGE